MSELRKLAEFIHDITWEQLPERVRETAALRVLDLVSVAAGASEDPLVREAETALGALSGVRLGEKSGSGWVSVWGRKEKYPLVTAAMIDAMMAHTLELDDVHTASKTHGSASLIPAAWTCAEYLGKGGQDLLLAIVCGYETVNRVGMAFGVSSHRNRGWHATATCGVFGCAAACAKLLDLDVNQIVSALGMAGTQSSGVWAFLGDGSNCKILHPARAAADGIEAAFLAKAGMTGPEHIFEAKDGGLLYAMSDGGDLSKLSEGLGVCYEILNMDMKPYPCCRSAHCAIDGILEIRKQMETRLGKKLDTLGEAQKLADQIQAIQIDTYLVGYKQCAVSDGCLHPKTVLDAKFSTPYSVAAAFLYGNVEMRQFEPEVVAKREIGELLDKVSVQPSERFTKQYPNHWGCHVTVTMKDGSVYEAEVEDPSGSAARPLTREQAMKKAKEFLSVACPGNAKEKMEELLNLAGSEKLPTISADFCVKMKKSENERAFG
ncbi:MmgE/PrpD family protein [Brotaphodocola sp.]|uniref:MmgE/PrpD family protein n=1 Tax=Brotaphodocola sp. TaxID=3073577 RepID=UPI003D7DF77E